MENNGIQPYPRAHEQRHRHPLCMGIVIASCFALTSFVIAGGPRKESTAMDNSGQRQSVEKWLAEAPFDDPKAMAAHPNFSYENWLDEGRRLPGAAELLMEMLANENLDKPSGNGERIAYAIGWLGDKRAVNVLLRALKSTDLNLRLEAVAALGRVGDAGTADALEKLVKDKNDNANVRANACISIGRLAPASGEKILQKALTDSDPFVVRSATEGLRLLREKRIQ